MVIGGHQKSREDYSEPNIQIMLADFQESTMFEVRFSLWMALARLV